MTVERSVRDDGRYLLYYSWPDPDVEPVEPDGDSAAHEDV